MKSISAVLIAACLLAFTACTAVPSRRASGTIEISEAWVRAAPAAGDKGANGALFMIITNHGNAADTLLSVETEAAHMAQIHITEVDANGVSNMREIHGLEIPAGESVELKSGSYHIMLMGLAQGVEAGGMASFNLIFKEAGMVVLEAPVKGP